jgi:hypothetical protein
VKYVAAELCDWKKMKHIYKKKYHNEKMKSFNEEISLLKKITLFSGCYYNFSTTRTELKSPPPQNQQS